MSEQEQVQESLEQSAASTEGVAQDATPEVTQEAAEIQNPDGYEKALKAERKARRELEKEMKALREAEEQRSREAMSEQERAIAEAREEARNEVKAEYDKQILKARVEAKAASLNFHDPNLALSLLEVDADASDDELMGELESLAKERPYLVKQGVPKMDMGPRTTGDGQSVSAVSSEDWFRQVMQGQAR
jgi:hypothetical protein